jgi:hypothetical protein
MAVFSDVTILAFRRHVTNIYTEEIPLTNSRRQSGVLTIMSVTTGSTAK